MYVHLKKHLKKNQLLCSTTEYIETLALKFSFLFSSCIYQGALRKHKAIFQSNYSHANKSWKEASGSGKKFILPNNLISKTHPKKETKLILTNSPFLQPLLNSAGFKICQAQQQLSFHKWFEKFRYVREKASKRDKYVTKQTKFQQPHEKFSSKNVVWYGMSLYILK